jgi:hypothetical protein
MRIVGLNTGLYSRNRHWQTPAGTTTNFPTALGLSTSYSDATCSCESYARVWRGGQQKWSSNEGQIPNTRGVRVHVSTGYHRVEGNRRASRNGRVSDLPPETLRSVLTSSCGCVPSSPRTRVPPSSVNHHTAHRLSRQQRGGICDQIRPDGTLARLQHA